MFRVRSVGLFFVFVLILAIGSVEATILRVDFCGAQFTRTQPVPIIRGRDQTVTVRGDLVDTITRVDAPTGITVIIGSKSGGGGLNTSVSLTIKSDPEEATPGNQSIKLRYFVEVSGPDVFVIDLRQVAIGSITINPPGSQVQEGSQVTITASGAGLNNLRLHPNLADNFTNFQNVSNNNSTFVFRGNARESSQFFANSFFDSSIIPQGIGCRSATGNATLSYTVGKPDLAISKATKVYRFVGNTPEACGNGSFRVAESKFCTELAGALPNPTQQNPHIEQLRNLGPVIYIVTNPSPFPITGSFRVQIKNGITLLKEDTINGLAAGDHKLLSYSRPENRRMLMRDINCPKCYDLQTPPYNWVDPVYTTIVDVDNQVEEQNENNNRQDSD